MSLTNLVKWKDLATTPTDEKPTLFNSSIVSSFSSILGGTSSINAIKSLGRYLYLKLYGVRSVFEDEDEYSANDKYQFSFIEFLESNKERLKFAYKLSMPTNPITKVVDREENATASPLKNINTKSLTGSIKNENDTTLNEKFNDNDSYIVSDKPEKIGHNENETTYNDFIEEKTTEKDEKLTIKETTTDPYSYMYTNKFIDNYRDLITIVMEYYNEWSCFFRL